MTHDANHNILRDALITWQHADARMRAAVAAELAAREALVTIAFPTPSEGTNNYELPDGQTLKGKFPNRYDLDKDVLAVQMVAKALPVAIRDALFKWKPEISITAYKALEPAHKKLVNEILTIKPGRAAVEIVEPKKR